MSLRANKTSIFTGSLVEKNKFSSCVPPASVSVLDIQRSLFNATASQRELDPVPDTLREALHSRPQKKYRRTRSVLSLLLQRNVAPALARFMAHRPIKVQIVALQTSSLYYIKPWQASLCILKSLISSLFSSRCSSPPLLCV